MMSKAVLVLAGIVLVLGVAVFFLIKGIISRNKRISSLNEELKNKDSQIELLKSYVVQISEIKTAREKKERELMEAQTNEEIIDVINDIINTNNNRMRKQ